MAKMIPPYLHNDIKSSAEKKIFNLINNENTLENWYCLHSLGLSKHCQQVEGEIDFVLLGPRGIYCLEVKGGRINRENGIWYYIDRYGEKHSDARGPFKQASEATFSLRDNMKSKFGNQINKVMFGYGVIFPDVEFEINTPEWDDKLIYDFKDKFNPFSKYIKRIIQFWHKKIPGKNKLTKSTIKKYLNYLRGDFEAIKSLTNQLQGVEEEIITLTDQQYRALDRMSNNKRIFFSGTAGTGKTLLAIEKVKRAAMLNKSVLLLCYNRVLSGKLSYEVSKIDIPGNIDVYSLHRYMYKKIKEAGFLNHMKKKKNEVDELTFYKDVYPEYFVESVRVLDFNPFECLIIDEGQDILCFNYFSALDYVLKGGFEEGEWVIFYDPNKQSGLYGNYSSELVNNLKSFGAAEYKLDINCRNTKQISEQTAIVSEFDIEKSPIDGEKVKLRWYKNEGDLIIKVNKEIGKLKSKNIQLNYITILYPGSDTKYEEYLNCLEWKAEKITYENAGNLPKNKISFCTVQSYKGLENNIIFFIGINNLTDEWKRVINYTGMTRAREILCLFIKEDLQDKYFNKISGFLDIDKEEI